MAFNKRFLKISSFCLIGSASAAAAASGIADTLSISIFAAAFAASWFCDIDRLRSLIPTRFFTVAAIVYLCFIPADFFLLSSDWQRVLLHAIWFTVAIKLITLADDKNWPPLYLICSIQWILAAAQPTGMIFRVCLAIFIASGVSSLMLFELRRSARVFKENSENAEKSNFSGRTLFTAVTGITIAVVVVAIPLFFFFPRLPVKSAAPPSYDTVSSFDNLFDEVETMELGRTAVQPQPDTVVMRVKTDAPINRLPYDLKWRGTSFDHYDGRAWMLLRREQQPTATQGRFYKLEESAMGSDLLNQTFFMEETLTNTIYAAHRALAVSIDAGYLRRDSSGNLSTQNPARGKVDYIVVSDATQPDADKISDWTPIPEDIRSTWLQLPALDPRVIQLANEITLGYKRQYDKARALESWLSSHYGYSETHPYIYEFPEDGDPLASFLFDTRVGHCGYFATAMTVMLRSIGIPARLASGFLPGEYNPVSGSWTVRRKHYHTWTEAWFPPYGWVEFDATPMEDYSPEPSFVDFFANLTDAAGLWLREYVAGYDAARQYSVVSGFFTRINQAEDSVGEFFSSSANRARSVINLLSHTATSVKITALVILFITVFAIFTLLRLRRRVYGVFRRSKQNPQNAAADFYIEALIFLKTRGFVPEKAQTPMEFARGFDAHPASATLIDLTRFYNEIRFGDQTVPFPRDEAHALLCSLKSTFRDVKKR